MKNSKRNKNGMISINISTRKQKKQTLKNNKKIPPKIKIQIIKKTGSHKNKKNNRNKKQEKCKQK